MGISIAIAIGTLGGFREEFLEEEAEDEGGEVGLGADVAEDFVGEAEAAFVLEDGGAEIDEAQGAEGEVEGVDAGVFEAWGMEEGGIEEADAVAGIVEDAEDVGFALGITDEGQFGEVEADQFESEIATAGGSGIPLDVEIGDGEEDAATELGRVVEVKVGDGKGTGEETGLNRTETRFDAGDGAEPVVDPFAHQGVLEKDQGGDEHHREDEEAKEPAEKEADHAVGGVGGSGHDNILGADVEAFVLIFPDEGGVMVEEFGEVMTDHAGDEFFSACGGVVIGAFIIPALFALAIVPVGHLVDLVVFDGPFTQGGLDGGGEVVEGHGSIAAMLAEEAGFDDIAGEERKEWGAAAIGFAIIHGEADQAFEPDAAGVADLGGEAVGSDQGVGHAPMAAFQLAEGLRHPTGQ